MAPRSPYYGPHFQWVADLGFLGALAALALLAAAVTCVTPWG